MSPTEQLKNEGFKHIYEWKDAAGITYPEHSHKDKVTLFITEGSIVMNINKKEIFLKKGDRYDVPPRTSHTAIVGQEGCEYVVGEIIEGDS